MSDLLPFLVILGLGAWLGAEVGGPKGSLLGGLVALGLMVLAVLMAEKERQ